MFNGLKAFCDIFGSKLMEPDGIGRCESDQEARIKPASPFDLKSDLKTCLKISLVLLLRATTRADRCRSPTLHRI